MFCPVVCLLILINKQECANICEFHIRALFSYLFLEAKKRLFRSVTSSLWPRRLMWNGCLHNLPGPKRKGSSSNYHFWVAILNFGRVSELANVMYQLVPPWNLTCPLKNDGWKMYFLLKWSLFRVHVDSVPFAQGNNFPLVAEAPSMGWPMAGDTSLSWNVEGLIFLEDSIGYTMVPPPQKKKLKWQWKIIIF